MFQWNHSTKECYLLDSEPDELIADHESLLGAADCDNIAIIWKKNPLASRLIQPNMDAKAFTNNLNATEKRKYFMS